MSMMLVPAKGGKKKTKEDMDEASEKKEPAREQVPAKSEVKE
jgi:hypothetical protein